MSKKVRLVQFDWSGTISDDRLPVHEANLRLSNELKVKPITDLETWLAQTTGTVVEYFKLRGITLPDEEIFRIYTKHFQTVLADGLAPIAYSGAAEILEILRSRGLKLAVLSSHPENNLIQEARNYGFADLFDLIIGGVQDKKDAIIDICKRFQVNPQNTIYIGDTITDIRAAKGAGVIAAGVTHGYHSRERLLSENPDHIWDSLHPAKEEIK